jgi:hypothetical protein
MISSKHFMHAPIVRPVVTSCRLSINAPIHFQDYGARWLNVATSSLPSSASSITDAIDSTSPPFF